MTQVEQESAIPGTAPTLVVRFLHVGVQLIGQLYEIHTLYNDEPVKEWDACDLHTQLTILSDSIGVGYPREIGPLSEQDQALDDLRASSHLTLEIILSRLKLILDFGPDPPLHAGELKKFWPREDVKGLEERIISLRLELGVAISSVERYVLKLFFFFRTRQTFFQVNNHLFETVPSPSVRLSSPWTLPKARKHPKTSPCWTKDERRAKGLRNLGL